MKNLLIFLFFLPAFLSAQDTYRPERITFTKPSYVNGATFRGERGSATATPSVPALPTRDTTRTEAGGYVSIGTTGNLYGAVGGRSFLNVNNETRIRENGYLDRVKFYVGARGVTSTFYIQVWRKIGSTYTLIGEENIYPKLPPDAGTVTIAITAPIWVNEGDMVGFFLGDDGCLLAGVDVTTAASSYYVNGDKQTTSYAWESASALTYVFPVKCYIQAPHAVIIGNSIVAGHPTHYSYIENSKTNVLANSISYQVRQTDTAIVIQNMGIGGETSTQIQARFKADVTDIKPKIAIIEGGVNDISGGSISQTTFISNYKKMLDSCAVHSITPVVLHILPWTDGIEAQMQKRDDWNASLDSLCALYTGSHCLNLDTAVGQNRVGGDVGNLWDIKTAYDEDGVHFNLDGYTKIAEIIAPYLYE